MRTLMLSVVLISALLSSRIEAQTTQPGWSIDIHASPYLFQGQIKQISDYYITSVSDYSFHTLLGVNLTTKLSEHFDVSISFDYTKASGNLTEKPVPVAAESSIPNNSFLTESYNSYLTLRYAPINLGFIEPYVSTGFGLTYFAYESKALLEGIGPLERPFYDAQRIMVPFVPLKAGMLFNVYQVENFRLGIDASVLAMYGLKKNVNFDLAGEMTQPISTGIVTGISIGW